MVLKKTYAIMWTQGTYETDHISLLCDSTIPIVLSACFFMYFIVVQKKVIILEEIWQVKKNVYCEISIILICQKIRVGRSGATKN